MTGPAPLTTDRHPPTSSAPRRRVLVASRIDADALELLGETHDVIRSFENPDADLVSLVADREVLIFRSGVTISPEVLAAAKDLRLIIRAGSGFDNIDLDAVRDAGVRLVRIPGPGAQAVAELTLGLMLSLARNITLADRLIRQGHWPKPDLGGPLLTGKTVGIVGAGNIGTRVGALCGALDMRPVGCVLHPSDAQRKRLNDAGIRLADFETVVAEADVLTVHASLNDTSFHLINEAVLSQMKPGSLLVNTSRGPVVDEPALYHALTAGGPPAGAALDVHEREGEGTVPRLAELPNVVLTPHIGAMGLDAQRAIGVRLVRLLGAFLDGSLAEVASPNEIVV